MGPSRPNAAPEATPAPSRTPKVWKAAWALPLVEQKHDFCTPQRLWVGCCPFPSTVGRHRVEWHMQYPPLPLPSKSLAGRRRGQSPGGLLIGPHKL
eukprot:9356614-Pyramimonas_sp.AAC.1